MCIRDRPPPEAPPMPRVECPECGFSFMVGNIAIATCPMCASDVSTGLSVPDPEPTAPPSGPAEPVPADEEE